MVEVQKKVLKHLEEVDKTGKIVMKGDPTINEPEDWATMLTCIEINEDFEKETVEIAKIDNAHGTPHIHRYFENGQKENDAIFKPP